MKTGASISEVHRDVVDTQVMVRNILKSREGIGGQDRSVSVTCVLSPLQNKL